MRSGTKRALLITSLVMGAYLVGGVVLLYSFTGCRLLDRGEPLPTVDGPEDANLAAHLEGWILWAEDDARDIRWLRLPSQRKGRIALQRDARLLLGVDDGRELLYIDEKDEVDRLQSVPLDGGPARTLLEFESPVGMARTDGGSRWLVYEAGRSLAYRSLKFAPGVVPPLVTRASDWSQRGFYWLEPGESLVYQALGRFQSPGEIRVLSLGTGDERMIMVGHHDLEAVDPTLNHLLVTLGAPQDGDLRLLRYDASGVLIEEDVAVPGLLMRILGVSPDGLIVYEGLPTTGTEQELLGWGMTWPRAKWTVKVADPRTGAFQTLIPYFDDDYYRPDPIAVLRPVED